MLHNTRLLFLFVLFLFLALCPIPALWAGSLPINSPMLLSFEPENFGQADEILVTGLTQRGTEVLIYIDGQFAGPAVVQEEGTPTDNFYFKTAIKLDAGGHTISALAKDKTSLVISSLSKEIPFEIKSLVAPTLIAPNEETVTGKVKPVIIGLTRSSTFVHVFIDDIYNGKTKIVTDKSGTANFAYKPFLNLSVGEHFVYTVAEDENGQTSGNSMVMKFRIEEPLPAPIVIKSIVNNETTVSQPFIIGLVKNDLKVNIFIDNKFSGQILPKDHESGTTNFAYKPFNYLTKGKHLVYATTIDDRGKESQWSNIINIEVGSQPAITVVAVEESASETIDETVEVKSAELTEPEVTEEKSDIEEAASPTDIIIDEEVKELIEQGISEEEEETGFINESKEQQGKLRLNLVIFILFLVAVIVWIFWVNRELIKERREQNEKDKDDTKFNL
ncbi:hypothetical protein K8R32_05515 [bacterium]|nr:hypothetical protein [bacterium]